MVQVVEQGRGTLARGAATVAEARADLDATGSRLAGQVQALQGRWVGAGGQAFFALHAAWTERQRALVGALDGFAEALAATGRDTAATDEAQASALARYQARLG